MSAKIETAIRCFDENIKMFGDPSSHPEKYNLYNGLACIAETIFELENQITSLQNAVQIMRYELSRKK